MIRVLSFVTLVASIPAWAVGEPISITGPARDQLSQTLCISMECGQRGGDYVVTSKVVAGKMELRVVGPSGLRLSLMMPLTDDGRLTNSDAMTATSQLVHAIETPAAAKEAIVEKRPAAKKSKLAKSTKQKGPKPMRLAARKLSRG